MAMQIYDAGLDALGPGWETDTFEWRALVSGTFTRNAPFVASALGTEISVSGYTAVALTGAARVVDTTLHRVTYGADNPSWAGLGSGQNIGVILLTKVVTDDTDSIPVGYWSLSPVVPTNAADPLIFDLAGGVVAYIDEAS